MRTRAAARVAWSSCALTGACWGLALSLRILGGAPLGPTRESSGAAGDALFAGLVVTTFVSVAILGALIAARTPQNVVGWLICGASVIIGYVVFAGGYAGYALHVAPGSPPGAATAVVAWLGACLG